MSSRAFVVLFALVVVAAYAQETSTNASKLDSGGSKGGGGESIKTSKSPGLVPMIGWGKHTFVANRTRVTLTIASFLSAAELSGAGGDKDKGVVNATKGGEANATKSGSSAGGSGDTSAARNMSRDAIVEHLNRALLPKIRAILQPFNASHLKDYGWIVSAKMDLPEDLLSRVSGMRQQSGSGGGGGEQSQSQSQSTRSFAGMHAGAGGPMMGDNFGPQGWMGAPPGALPMSPGFGGFGGGVGGGIGALREASPTANVRHRRHFRGKQQPLLQRQMEIQRQQALEQEFMNQLVPLLQFTGYDASKTIDFEVAISDLPLLLDKFNSLNATITVDNLRYAISYEERQKAMSVALENAGKDAASRANALLKGLTGGDKKASLLLVRDVRLRHPRRHVIQRGSSFALQFPAYMRFGARVEALFTAA